MLNWTFRLLITSAAVYLLCWSGVRLSCLFYSAFEFAQAELINASLPAFLRALGIRNWLYGRFFASWHAGLLVVRMISAAVLIVQFFVQGNILMVLTAAYLLFVLISLALWYMNRVEGRDRYRYAPYNTFAPLHDQQRRELNRQRNQVRLTGLFQRLDIFNHAGYAEPSTDKQKALADRYRKL